MIMFFDVETTGLPKDWRAPMNDLENWPRVIQLAWLSTDPAGEQISFGNFLIKPEGWEIPKEKFWTDHGFTTEKSLAQGYPLVESLTRFVADLQSCEFLVSHNMDFDYNVLGSEMIRLQMVSPKKPLRICTKEASVNVCKIPFAGQRNWPGRRTKMQYKWPKLEELYRHLFNKDIADAHDALGDVKTLRDCFFELCKRKVITLTPDGVSIQ
jgi:DNA polymerase-3 subunit epsilon